MHVLVARRLCTTLAFQLEIPTRCIRISIEYDVRMKDWTGAGPSGGDGIYHISGGKRDQVKRFLEEKRYVVTTEFYHYIIRAQGKKVDPVMLSQKIQNMGLKFIWVHVAGQTGPEKALRKMRLNRL